MVQSITSRVPIRLSVPLLLVMPVCLVAGVLSWIAYQQAQNAARNLTGQNVQQIHDQIEGHIDNLLSAPGRINQVNAQLFVEGRLPLDDLAAWRDTLIEQMHAYDMLSTVGWGGADGRATWVCRYIGDDEHTYYALKDGRDGETMIEYRVDLDGSVETEPSSTFDFDPRVRPWYQAPVKAGAAAWCEPFLWVGGGDTETVTLGISYGLPMYDDQGQVLGVMDSDLSLNDISRYLERLEIGKTGGVYLVDTAGLMIGSSTEADLAEGQGDRLLATHSRQTRIAHSAEHIEQIFGSFSDFDEVYRQTIEVDGERLFLMASPFEHDTGLRWVIVTLVPEVDFLAEVHAAQRRGLMFGTLAILLTLLFGLAASVFMVRPILALTDHARHIGEGDLDREIELHQSPELARLSHEINEMTVGLRDRLRMRQSLEVAMDVQQALLPSQTPNIKGLDVAGHSTYCDETGGDYYDFLDISDVNEQSLAIALGDVMGHGVAAAMLMATARGILRSRSQDSGSLSDLLNHMNRLLVPDTGGWRFMTMLLLTLNAEKRELRWASAGHEPPFIYDPKSGDYRELQGAGLPLGIMEDEVYKEFCYEGLSDGQVLFIATDGVWEMKNPAGEQFGKHRVRDLIERCGEDSAEQISQAIRDALSEFRGEALQDDDVTYVVVRVC